MNYNTFLMIGLLLSGNAVFADGIVDTVTSALAPTPAADGSTDVTNTGEGDTTVSSMKIGAGAISVPVDINILVNNCSGTAVCTNINKSKSKGANAVGDILSHLDIAGAQALSGDLRKARIALPRAGSTAVYSFVLSSGSDKGSTVYLALEGTTLDRSLNEASKNAPKNHDTFVVLSVNINGEKGTTPESMNDYLFTETGSLSFNSRALRSILNPGIGISIQADGTARVGGINVPLNFNRNIVTLK